LFDLQTKQITHEPKHEQCDRTQDEIVR
jgi:hypothetical protein